MAFYDSIKLEKGMYQTSKGNFTEVLEKIDPSENYEGTELLRKQTRKEVKRE